MTSSRFAKACCRHVTATRHPRTRVRWQACEPQRFLVRSGETTHSAIRRVPCEKNPKLSAWKLRFKIAVEKNVQMDDATLEILGIMQGMSIKICRNCFGTGGVEFCYVLLLDL